MKKRTLNRNKALNILGCVMLILAIALFVLAHLMQTKGIAEHYQAFLGKLSEFEMAVASIPNKWMVIVAILLLFLARSVIPIPITVLCVIPGMVFPTGYAVAINISGFLILLTTKFYWGKRLGGGAVTKIFSRYDNVRRMFESNGKGSAWLLLAFRLVPSFPINPVSQLYGAMGCEFHKYLWISLLGLMPKVISYSVIGRNVYDPFSMAFLLPIILLLLISGVSTLGVNIFLNIYSKRNKDKAKPIKQK